MSSNITAITFEFTREQIGMSEAPVVKVRVMHRGEAVVDYGIETTGDKGHIPSLEEIIDAKNKAHEIFEDQPYMEETKFE
tara:strand:- start:1390 stop:1629 length:240 start_codon:yes stop_codon:yes gene_type:complete